MISCEANRFSPLHRHTLDYRLCLDLLEFTNTVIIFSSPEPHWGRGGDALHTINICLLSKGRYESKQAYPVLLAGTTLNALGQPTLVEILP